MTYVSGLKHANPGPHAVTYFFENFNFDFVILPLYKVQKTILSGEGLSPYLTKCINA